MHKAQPNTATAVITQKNGGGRILNQPQPPNG